jgi:tRNA pseudouridine32 synthase/23S rRNA pseudouridine746 synthase
MNEIAENPSYYIAPCCDEPLRVLHVDDDLIVVEKPAFLYTVPGRGPENHDAVITRLLTKFVDAVIVHRLDLDTSGLLVVARSLRARQELSRQIRERTMRKIYQAVVWGIVENDEGVIDLPIGKDWDNRPRCKIDYETGKSALTRYSVLSRDFDNKTTVLRLEPETGRQHQLRLHLKTLGHPILGCDLYAHDQALNASPRLMLHASELGFLHPDNQTWMKWRSDFILPSSGA